MWRTLKPIIVPRKAPHTYLYALFEAGKFARWEPVQTARTCFPEARAKTVTGDVFGVLAPLGAGGVASVPELATLLARHGADVARVPRTLQAPPAAPAAGGGRRREIAQQPRLALRGGGRRRGRRAPAAPPRSAAGRAARPAAAPVRLLIVCFHLPLNISRDASAPGGWRVVWAESLIARTEDSVADSMSTTWVGTVFSDREQLLALSDDDRAQITELLEPLDCVPIFPAGDVVDGAYRGYCKQIAVALFHNVDILDPRARAGTPRPRTPTPRARGTRRARTTGGRATRA